MSKISKLLKSLVLANDDGKLSLTNVSHVVTLVTIAYAPNGITLAAFALSLLNYNAKRFGVFYFNRKENAEEQRLQNIESELKALISSNEMRKISR